MNKVTIYADMLSQPCRAVVILCEMINAPYSLKEARIMSGFNRSEEFGQINPLKKVPAMTVTRHSGEQVNLFQTTAMMKYLLRMQGSASHWYPQHSAEECKDVDMALDFYLSTLRPNAIHLVFNQLFAENIGMKKPAGFSVERAVKKCNFTIADFQKVFLKDCTLEKPFVAGRDNISIADLMFFCEIVQVLLVKENSFFLDKSFEKTCQWMQHMIRIEAVHKMHLSFFKIMKKLNPPAFQWLKQESAKL